MSSKPGTLSVKNAGMCVMVRTGTKRRQCPEHTGVSHGGITQAGSGKLPPMAKNVWLGSTSGLEFENVCTDIFKGCGFAAKKIGGSSDGGRDILVWNGQDKIVVECKHHAKQIGRPVVQKLHSAVITERAVGGIIVSTGGFSSAAVKHPQARTSLDVLDTIRHIRQGDIILVNLDELKSLARNADMRLHDGLDPDTRDVQLAPLKALFANLKSNPTTAEGLISFEICGHHVDTYWVVDVELKQDFYNRARKRVHRMKKKQTYVCSSDGRIIDGKLAKLVRAGGDTVSHDGDWAAAKRSVVSDMRRRYKKKVGYKGSNGAHYDKVCDPSAQHMHFNPKPVGVNSTDVSVKVLRTKYNCSMPLWDFKILCRVCGEPSKNLNPLMICNHCGAISHVRGCGGQCNKCKKTICEQCAVTQRKMLRKIMLCQACFTT